MDIYILLFPPVAFGIFLLAGLGLYGLGRLMAGKVAEEPNKSEAYACGEEFPASRYQFGYARFYVAALFFTVMHVAALTVATVPNGEDALKALAYLLVIAVSIAFLFFEFD